MRATYRRVATRWSTPSRRPAGTSGAVGLDVRLGADPGALPRASAASNSRSSWSRRPTWRWPGHRIRRARRRLRAHRAGRERAAHRQAARNIRRFFDNADRTLHTHRADAEGRLTARLVAGGRQGRRNRAPGRPPARPRVDPAPARRQGAAKVPLHPGYPMRRSLKLVVLAAAARPAGRLRAEPDHRPRPRPGPGPDVAYRCSSTPCCSTATGPIASGCSASARSWSAPRGEPGTRVSGLTSARGRRGLDPDTTPRPGTGRRSPCVDPASVTGGCPAWTVRLILPLAALVGLSGPALAQSPLPVRVRPPAVERTSTTAPPRPAPSCCRSRPE